MRIARDVDNGRLSPQSLPVGAQTLDWVRGLRAYLAVVVVANLIWEFAHLPLYTIWQSATPDELAFAAVHCTSGDVVIAATCLSIALVLAGDRRWPDRSFGRVAALSVVLGIGYTIFSEWLNIVVRESWAYSELMPGGARDQHRTLAAASVDRNSLTRDGRRAALCMQRFRRWSASVGVTGPHSVDNVH